ncbi:general transcription factor 3C polypeptide 6-like protein [Camelus ferus]|nr:general transcription factor 3C polypeptide 6-like protein [Camelus ferus]
MLRFENDAINNDYYLPEWVLLKRPILDYSTVCLIRSQVLQIPHVTGAAETWHFSNYERHHDVPRQYFSNMSTKEPLTAEKGIDTERPILQVDSYVFAGEYEDTLGTCVIFEETVEHGGVEWLQIKDNDFSYRPNMICSFLHENEDEEVVAPDPDKPLELEEQEIQVKDNSNLSYEQGKPPNLETEDSGPLTDIPSSETEGSVFTETQDTALEVTPR